MNTVDWKGLRPGDEVLVHQGPALHLTEGTIRFLTTTRGRRPDDVGIALTDGRVVWPTPAEVHTVPRSDDTDDCWRCSFDPRPADCDRRLARHPIVGASVSA